MSNASRSAARTINLKTCAIVVTHNPDTQQLRHLVEVLHGQTDFALIVDNGSQWDHEALIRAIHEDKLARFQVLRLDENTGVAAGHNRGIAWARERGFSRVLLLDQDSMPAPEMAMRLLEALDCLTREGLRVAALGPRYVDNYTGHSSPFVRFGKLAIKRTYCITQQSGQFVETDFLITSGCLIPMSVIDDVGLMDEGLFIDHVDTDWMLRAKHKGYRTFGVCDAEMRHSLGDGTMRFWFLRWRMVPLHSPERHYYMFRNSLHLFRRPYAPRQWIIIDIVRLMYIAVFYPIFAPDRLRRIKLMLKGIWHGLLGMQGSLR